MNSFSSFRKYYKPYSDEEKEIISMALMGFILIAIGLYVVIEHYTGGDK